MRADESFRLILEPGLSLRATGFCITMMAAAVLTAGSSKVLGADWAQVVASAKNEAKVVVSGITGVRARKLLSQGIQAQYPGIHVEYSGLTGRRIAPRILAERRAGKKLWDVYIGGGNTAIRAFKPAGALLDLRPAFLLPEVKEDRYWHGGRDFGYVDVEKRYIYSACANIGPTVHVNRSSVPAKDFNDPRQLLKPEFKGKIIMNDPRGSGPGSVDLTSLMVGYGEDFIKKLLTDQGVVFSRNIRQVAEWVVRGRYPIAVGATEGSLQELAARGLGKEVESVLAPEVDTIVTGACTLALFEGGPHPNAAKVYANWFLSKSAQEQFSRTTAFNSRRTDVPPADPKIFPKLNRLKQYPRNDEAWIPYRLKSMSIARRIIK